MERQAAERMTAQDVLAQLRCSSQGLSQTEAIERRAQFRISWASCLSPTRCASARPMRLPRQVLLISLVTDVPLVAISTDAVSSGELEQPRRCNARALLGISLVLGTLTALVELAFFATLRGQAASVSQTSLYLFLSFTQLIVILSVRNRDHFWKAVRPSRPLLGAMVPTAAITLAIPFILPRREE